MSDDHDENYDDDDDREYNTIDPHDGDSSDGNQSDDHDDDRHDHDDHDDDEQRDQAGAAGGSAQAVVEYLVTSLVEHPDEVRVEADERRGHLQFDVFVDRDDMGRVIGKRGRVANSIRSVVRSAASRDDADLDVDVEFVD